MSGVPSLTVALAVGGIIACLSANNMLTDQSNQWHPKNVLQYMRISDIQRPVSFSVDDTITNIDRNSSTYGNQTHLCAPVPANCSCEMFEEEGGASVAAIKQTKECCSRYILTTHKMGYMLADSMRIDHGYEARFETVEAQFDFHLPQIRAAMQRNVLAATPNDFREVFVLRDVYSALISGYLYHKSGKECTLSPMGKPTGGGWLTEHNWTGFIYNAGWGRWLDPPPKERHLCQYLEEEDEATGVKAYTLYAYINHLLPLWEILKTRRRHAGDCGRVMYVCQKELGDRDRFVNTTRSVVRFLKLQERKIGLPGRLFGKKKTNGHMTVHDDELRLRLKGYVQDLDREQLNSTLVEIRELVGCEEEVP